MQQHYRIASSHLAAAIITNDRELYAHTMSTPRCSLVFWNWIACCARPLQPIHGRHRHGHPWTKLTIKNKKMSWDEPPRVWWYCHGRSERVRTQCAWRRTHTHTFTTTVLDMAFNLSRLLTVLAWSMSVNPGGERQRRSGVVFECVNTELLLFH